MKGFLHFLEIAALLLNKVREVQLEGNEATFRVWCTEEHRRMNGLSHCPLTKDLAMCPGGRPADNDALQHVSILVSLFYNTVGSLGSPVLQLFIFRC
jgi:hypothetical protein